MNNDVTMYLHHGDVNIVVDLADMYSHAIDRTKYTLQPQTQWWLGQLDPGLADPVDLRLAVTLDVLREVVNIFSESGFQMVFSNRAKQTYVEVYKYV